MTMKRFVLVLGVACGGGEKKIARRYEVMAFVL